MTHRDPSDPRVRLVTVTDEAWELHERLEANIMFKDVMVGEGGRVIMINPSLPWNSRVSFALFDLRLMARRIEADFVFMVAGTHRVRGTSDRNTMLALKAIPRLSESVLDDDVLRSLKELDQWNTRAKLALDDLDEVSHVPDTTSGQEQPMRCPWCDYLTLRMRMATLVVRCVNPTCQYSEDDPRRPNGRADVDPITGVITVEWQGELPAAEMGEAA